MRRIGILDNLLREQCTDIAKLMANKDGLVMEMDDLKRFHEEVIDATIVSDLSFHYK